MPKYEVTGTIDAIYTANSEEDAIEMYREDLENNGYPEPVITFVKEIK